MAIMHSQYIQPDILPRAAEQISYIESYGNYVKIYFIDKSVSIKRITLKAMLAELPEAFFSRIHNRHIVNLNQIETVHQDYKNGMRLTLKNHDSPALQVSRSYQSPFRKCYKKFRMYDIPFAKNDPGYCF